MIPTKKWLQLLDADKEEDRLNITEELLDSENNEFIKNIREQVDHALAVIAVEAQQEADVYWNANRTAQEEGLTNEQCRIGTRVRIIGVSLVAEWYRNRFFKNDPKQKKKSILSTHIKKGRSNKYSMSHFKKEPNWAQDLIKQIEDRYVILRQRNAALTKIRRAIREYERLLNKK